MKVYHLLVLRPSFVTQVKDYLNELCEFIESNPLLKGRLPEEEFRKMMWISLKKYWMCKHEDLPKGFGEMLPDYIKESNLTIVSKQAREELQLDNGTTVPKFNYAGKCIDAGQIPHILGIMGERVTVEYTSEGATPEGAQSVLDALKKFSQN